MSREWTLQAIEAINADFNRSSDTHLLKFQIPVMPQIQIYFKDESTHITGSLKHRLARSLFLYGLCNGWITEDTPIVEASSGSTAISEAYFAKLLGLRFIAVMAKSTSPLKIKRIENFGGECVLVDDPAQDCEAARQLAKDLKGHFMDQFTYAERATDWRGNNNIAESIYSQMVQEPNPIPRWIVVGAGTGGTSSTIGRYIRYRSYPTKLCVVDPIHSVFYQYYCEKNLSLHIEGGSGVEGIGRPMISPSFLPNIIDKMVQVPNPASYAAMQFLAEKLGKKPGGSTGTNFYGVLQLLIEMAKNGEQGSIVTLLCDAGSLYQDSYYSEEWLKQNKIDLRPYLEQLNQFYDVGIWKPIA